MSETEAPAPDLFADLRTDPSKAESGVWVTHPRTRDRFQVRRRGSPEFWRTWFEALDDYEKQHGEGSRQKPEALRYAEAVAMAKVVVVGWDLTKHPGLAYDPARMAAALGDEQLRQDLLAWLLIETDGPTNFRPDAIAGN